MPEGDWIGMREAAELWSRISEHEVSEQTFRRWVARKDWRIRGVLTTTFMDRYSAERGSLLQSWEDYCKRALAIIEEERKGKE